jgi:hypothetical protein
VVLTSANHTKDSRSQWCSVNVGQKVWQFNSIGNLRSLVFCYKSQWLRLKLNFWYKSVWRLVILPRFFDLPLFSTGTSYFVLRNAFSFNLYRIWRKPWSWAVRSLTFPKWRRTEKPEQTLRYQQISQVPHRKYRYCINVLDRTIGYEPLKKVDTAHYLIQKPWQSAMRTRWGTYIYCRKMFP